jgi:hypothetical protein
MTHNDLEDPEQLVPTGDERSFLGLVGSVQALVEGADDGVVARGDQRGHVQHPANPRPPQMMRRLRSVPWHKSCAGYDAYSGPCPWRRTAAEQGRIMGSRG